MGLGTVLSPEFEGEEHPVLNYAVNGPLSTMKSATDNVNALALRSVLLD